MYGVLRGWQWIVVRLTLGLVLAVLLGGLMRLVVWVAP